MAQACCGVRADTYHAFFELINHNTNLIKIALVMHYTFQHHDCLIKNVRALARSQ